MSGVKSMLQIGNRVIVLSLSIFSLSASALHPLDGQWRLFAKRCQSAQEWALLPQAFISINSRTQTYSIKRSQLGCESLQVGRWQLKSANELIICNPIAHAFSSCPTSEKTAVEKINSHPEGSDCSAVQEFQVSPDGADLILSKSALPSDKCKENDRVYLKFEKVNYGADGDLIPAE